MKRSFLTGVFLASVLCLAAAAQTVVPKRVVRASGQASISVEPDQAMVNAGVTSKAPTAAEAASQNAIQVDKVLAELRRVLGANAGLKTINYSLSPEYEHKAGEPARLVGFTANNTVQVTINDLSLIGTVIDAAMTAGATNVHGLRFTLQDPEPLRRRALAAAAQQARENAQAIAAGLGEQVGAVLVAQEGSTVQSAYGPEIRDVAGAKTPIEPGLVDVRAFVAVEMELR